MFSLALCGRLRATKSKSSLGVSDAHRPVSDAGLFELCQSSHHVIRKSSHVAKSLPGWQPARCVGASRCLQAACPPQQRQLRQASPAIGCDAHPWVGRAARSVGACVRGQNRVTCLRLAGLGRQSRPLLSPGFQTKSKQTLVPNGFIPSVCKTPEKVRSPLNHHVDDRTLNKNDESWKAGMILFFNLAKRKYFSSDTVLPHF